MNNPLPILFGSLAACRTPAPYDGGLRFIPHPWGDESDFKPLPVGGRLDIQVASGIASYPATQPRITFASSDDPDVLDVVAFEGDTVTVAGISEGTAGLTVEAGTDSGSLQLSVLAARAMKLEHLCAREDTTAAYLTGRTVFVAMDLGSAGGVPLMGYGYYPVTVSGEALLDDTTRDLAVLALTTSTNPGAATIDSDLDDATLDLEIVDSSSFDGVEQPQEFTLGDTRVGFTTWFYVHPTVGGRVVCQAPGVQSVTTETPTICAVRAESQPHPYEFAWFAIEGLSAGACLYTVTWPTGTDSVSAHFSREILP